MGRSQRVRTLIATIAAACLAPPPAIAQENDLGARLADALARADRTAVARVVADAVRVLGDKAGVPEVPDTYLPVPNGATWLTRDEAQRAFAPLLEKIATARWWNSELDPTKLKHALREPASVVSGCVAAYRAGLDGADAALGEARTAADFLLRAQTQAGRGCFPFPAYPGESEGNAFAAAKRFLERAEREGRLQDVVHNGWIVDDPGDGGLQFDNAEAGVAMFEVYEVTGDERYLKSAIKAADWAIARPLVVNWNYNSFSVHLLARAFEVTADGKYLGAATHKAIVGVIPGQLADGINAGRWVDPHNARPSYHYIMLRALTALARVMPNDDPTRADVIRALRRGLLGRNREFTTRGVCNKDNAMQTLLIVNRTFRDEPQFIVETHSDQALDALGRLVSNQAREGQLPLGPREWALFLEYLLEN